MKERKEGRGEGENEGKGRGSGLRGKLFLASAYIRFGSCCRPGREAGGRERMQRVNEGEPKRRERERTNQTDEKKRREGR